MLIRTDNFKGRVMSCIIVRFGENVCDKCCNTLTACCGGPVDMENKVWNTQLCTISKVLVQSLYNIDPRVVHADAIQRKQTQISFFRKVSKTIAIFMFWRKNSIRNVITWNLHSIV